MGYTIRSNVEYFAFLSNKKNFFFGFFSRDSRRERRRDFYFEILKAILYNDFTLILYLLLFGTRLKKVFNISTDSAHEDRHPSFRDSNRNLYEKLCHFLNRKLHLLIRSIQKKKRRKRDEVMRIRHISECS